jgi:hypothetical protein
VKEKERVKESYTYMDFQLLVIKMEKLSHQIQEKIKVNSLTD